MLALPPPVIVKSFAFSENGETSSTAQYFFMVLSDVLRRVYEAKGYATAPAITSIRFFFCGLDDFRDRYAIEKISTPSLRVYTDGGVRVRAVIGEKKASECNTKLCGLGVCFALGGDVHNFGATSCIMETSRELTSDVVEIVAHIFGILLSNLLFSCPDVSVYYDLESLRNLTDNLFLSKSVRKALNRLSHRGHYAPNGILGHWYINVAHNLAILYQKENVLDRRVFLINSGAMLLSKQNNTNFLKDCQ